MQLVASCSPNLTDLGIATTKILIWLLQTLLFQSELLSPV